MKKVFTKLWAGFKKLLPKNKITMVGGLLLLSLSVFALVVYVLPVHAEIMEETANAMMMFVSETMLAMGELCIRLMIFCLRFFIDLASYNNYVDVSIVMLGWTMVRDVCNMFFVVVFLMIAIGTILGIEQYQWNKTLAKLILAAVFINFSNLICGIFIDIAQVFTMTFVNAVAATAGGNLISMFHLNDMFSLMQGASTSEADAAGKAVVTKENINLRLLSASIASFLFALLAFISVAAYTVVMLVRVVVLWILIILSPIAFIAQVIPQTQSYAKEWWTEFGKNVMVAPLMVFFLWLAFATAGDGKLASKMNLQIANESNAAEGEYLATDVNAAPDAVSMASITKWSNLANLLVPMMILWVGLEKVQKLGAQGGGVVGSAGGLFKTAAAYATGLTAAKWVGKTALGGVKSVGNSGLGLVKSGAKLGLTYMPFGGDWWKDRAKLVGSMAQVAWYRGVGQGDIPGYDKLGKTLGFVGKWTGLRSMANRTSRRKKRVRAMETAVETSEKIIAKEQSASYAGNLKRGLEGDLVAMEMRSAPRDKAGVDEQAAKRLGMMRMKDNKPTGLTWAQEAAKYTTESDTASKEKESMVIKERAKNREDAAVELQEKKQQEQTIRNTEKTEEERRLEVLIEEKGRAIDVQQAKVLDNLPAEMANDRSVFNQKVRGLDKTISDSVVTRDLAMNAHDSSLSEEDRKKRNKQLEEKEAQLLLSKDGNQTEAVRQKAKDEVARIDGELKASLPEDVIELVKKVEKYVEEKKKEISTYETDARNKQEEMAKRLREDVPYSTLQKERKSAQEDLVKERKKPKSDEMLGIEKDNDLVIAYIEGGEEKLRAELKKQDPSLSDYDLEQRVLGLSARYAKQSYTPGYKTGGAKNVLAELEHHDVGARLKAAESSAKEEALGLEGARDIFYKSQVYETMAEAADKFVDKIKQIDLQKIFDGGLKNMQEEEKLQTKLSKIEYGIKKDDNPQTRTEKEVEAKRLRDSIKDLRKDKGAVAGVRLVRAEVAQGYEQELTGTSRQAAKDQADDEFSLEKYGFHTPATAFKSLIKKKMEEFTSVEREEAVEMAMGNLSKLITLRESGVKLSKDQEALMMASNNYLTKQAWSDDLLARISSKIRMGESGQLTGAERDRAADMKKIFIDQFGWGEVDENGKLNLTNESSNIRTNQLHRTIGYAGDYGLVEAEDAVLDRMKTSGLGYSGAVEDLAKQVMEQLQSKGIGHTSSDLAKVEDHLGTDEFKSFAAKLDFDFGDKKDKNNLSAFVRKFVVGAKEAGDALESFRDEIKSHGEANQMLADAKNMAMQNAHLDDGGHTYYDMDEGFIRGQSAESAMQFILSDWRKLGADVRMSRMKSHSIGQMNEDSQTLAVDAHNADAIRETFQNVDTELIFNKLDGRTQDHMAGLAAGEKAIIDPITGAMVLCGEQSVMQTKTFGHLATAADREKHALEQVADNLAVLMNNAPLAAAAALGKRSGIAWDQATMGEFNIQLPEGQTLPNGKVMIKTKEDMLDFIEKYRSDDSKKTVVLNKGQISGAFDSQRAKRGKDKDKDKGKGKGKGKNSTEESNEE